MHSDLPAMLQALTTLILPVVIAVPLHEAAHGYAAYLLGDDTAKRLGRVTLNPLRHVDPFGTVLLPALLFLFGGFLFGYAKPVPVNFRRLNHPRRDMVLVALAGPGMNIGLAIIAGILLRFAAALPAWLAPWTVQNLWNALELNVVLAVFNMFPLPPLDGGRVAVGVLPRRLGLPLARLEPYGMLILLGLIFVLPMLGQQLGRNFNIMSYVVMLPSQSIINAIASLTGLQ